MLRNSSFTPSCLSPSIFSVFASHLRIALPSLFCCFWAAARSRGAVRLIRARVQQAIRWAFVTSRVSNSGGRGSTAHPHSGKIATAKKIQRAEMKEILCKALSFIWVNLMHCTNIMLYAFYLCIVFLDYVITYFSLSSCMLYYVLIGHQLWTVFYFDLFISLFLFASSSLSERISWVLLLFATIITGVVVVETFPFVWTPPVSSRCHFAFHPHPLVRISAALLAGCLLVSIAHCGLWFAM